jgi:hypothetical protein
MDITQLILDDHHEQRRLFAVLEQIDPNDVASLTPIWARLASFLEMHAAAEEKLFYPQLLQIGRGDGKHTPEAETKDAIKDHNEIRDAVELAKKHDVGTPEWYAAVAKANAANSDHMAEEEREGLTDFRMHAPLTVRHDLAVAFATFEAVHFMGVRPVDKDPDRYVKENAAR